MYSYTPQRKNKKAVTLTILSFISAFIVFYISTIVKSYSLVFQAVSFILLTIGIMITTKYLLKQYTYSVETYAGGFDFIVNATQGKRIETVCKVGES